ncbi:MAG: acyl-CoA synthetase FdrA [Chloroflexi bacterium]|nr:acyl-CoA synthetase FdrA [Chloroflexota bacterium]
MQQHLLIKPHAYHDSVTLMSISQQLAALPGVAQAVIVMATEHNKTLLADVGLLTDEARAALPDDLVIAMEAEDATAMAAAIEAAEVALKRGGASRGDDATIAAPRTLNAALKQLPDADLAVISVPGAFAKREALRALHSGLNVLLFSDNVALEDEIELKQLAREKGLLCMGPDCGTAILGGVGLCFANVVRRGTIGIVSASGTGAQEVSVLIDRYGGGVSQLIGTGGRDLRPEVGGLMMRSGIELLARDEQTETILLISKPPHPEVAATVLADLRASGKRGIACLLGYRGELPADVELATNLRDAAALAVGQAALAQDDIALGEIAQTQARRIPAGGSRLRGLFSGGTLCDEAKLTLAQMGLSERAELIDYGDDQYTVGRPHPMIDWTLRLQQLRATASDPTTAVLLLDVVLGYGSHPDPASVLAPVLREIAQPVVVYVCGTDADPQGRSHQIAQLQAAGAIIGDSNYEAAGLAGLILKTEEASA